MSVGCLVDWHSVVDGSLDCRMQNTKLHKYIAVQIMSVDGSVQRHGRNIMSHRQTDIVQVMTVIWMIWYSSSCCPRSCLLLVCEMTVITWTVCLSVHRRSQGGAGGAGAPPRATGKKFFSRQFLLKWGKNGVNLARCTPADEILVAYVTDMTMQKKVMTKKRSSDFWSGKVHPRRENPGYAYADLAVIKTSPFDADWGCYKPKSINYHRNG